MPQLPQRHHQLVTTQFSESSAISMKGCMWCVLALVMHCIAGEDMCPPCGRCTYTSSQGVRDDVMGTRSYCPVLLATSGNVLGTSQHSALDVGTVMSAFKLVCVYVCDCLVSVVSVNCCVNELVCM